MIGCQPDKHVSYHDPGFSGRLHVRRVNLNSGGYDALGTYFGLGAPLYWAASDCGAVDYMLRAPDRAAARAIVLARYPEAKVRP